MIALGADGSETTIDAMTKACSGFGSSNLLSSSEPQSPAGHAMLAIFLGAANFL